MTSADILGTIAIVAALALILGAVQLLRAGLAPSASSAAKPELIEIDGDLAPANPRSAGADAVAPRPAGALVFTGAAALVCAVAVLANAVFAGQEARGIGPAPDPVADQKRYSADLFARLPPPAERQQWKIYIRACLTDDAFARQIERLRKAGFMIADRNTQNADRLVFSPVQANTVTFYSEDVQEQAETVSLFLERDLEVALKATLAAPVGIAREDISRSLKIFLADPRCTEGRGADLSG
jgi:hypothetical protein